MFSRTGFDKIIAKLFKSRSDKIEYFKIEKRFPEIHGY